MSNFKKKPIPIQKMIMFAETVKQGSITKAADKLCVTQPAVSTSIKQLEEYFDTKLLEVVRKKIHFTASGRALHDNWQNVTTSLDNLHLAMESFHAGIAGELRLVMVSSGKYFIPQVIYNFLKEHPKVNFSCDIKRREIITESMENNRYDIAILTNPPHSKNFSQFFLMDNPLVFIAHPNHPLAKASNVTLKSLEKAKFILREPTALISQKLFDLFTKNNLELDIMFEMDSTEAIKQSVISGLGVALVPELSIKNELRHKDLKVINIDGVSITNEWFLICSKATEELTLFTNFLEHLQNKVNE